MNVAGEWRHECDAVRVFEAFRSSGAPEDKALKAAEALARRDDDVVELKAAMRLTQWMQGFTLALVTATFVKLFLH